MPAGENFLKALFVLKRKEAGGFDCYFNRKGNYDREEEFLGAWGWRSWQDVHDGRPGQLPGYVAVQMRPRVTLLADEQGMALHAAADYCAPFDQWKFALRHQPHELPGWVHVAEVKAECLRLLPAWAELHLFCGNRSVTAGMAVAALAGSRIEQHGGSLWAFGDASVFQRGPGPHDTHLHDRAVGYISTGYQAALAFDHSTAHVYHLGHVRAFGSATIILHPGGQHGTTGKFMAYGPGVKAFIMKQGRQVPFVNFHPIPDPHTFSKRIDVNQPFGCEVD